ncbi:phage tailspike polysaccharide lyase family protein [Chitinophaga sp. RAB17]|uniref:phage tailspike polysaccharide lyase family protein n=1 Tax=Chitinophaga sp. RAB17 TaxID=3233049 RepID=UPI003F93A244
MTIVNINALRSIAVPQLNEAYNVLGHSVAGDGGGGVFYWDSTDVSSPDNDGTIISSINTNGRWKRIFDGSVVNAKWFGARGDGISDDTGALSRAFKYNVFIPEGRYKITSTIIVTNNIILNCAKGAIIDISAITNTYAIVCRGEASSPTPLLADLKQNDTVINFSGTCSKGDLIRLQSSALWNPARPEYIKGELCEVDNDMGAGIRVTNAIYDNYTASLTTVSIINYIRVEINNLSLYHTGGNCSGLSVSLGKNILLRNCTVTGSNERAIEVSECFGVDVVDCYTNGDFYTDGHTNYGLVILSSQHVIINGGFYKGGRHGIATGGTYPCRDIKHLGLTVDNDKSSESNALDAHGNGDYFEYSQVNCLNSALLQARNIKVSDSFFKTISYKRCLEFLPEVTGGYYIMDNLSFENVKDNCAVGMFSASVGNSIDMVSMTNLKATVAGDGAEEPSVYRVDQGAGLLTIKQLYVANLSATVQKDAAIARHIFSIGTVSPAVSVNAMTLTSCNFDCNKAFWASFYIRVTGGDFNISQCLVKTSNIPFGAQILASPACNVTLKENIFDSNQSASFCYFYNVGVLRITENTIRNSSRPGVRVQEVPLCIYANNNIANVSFPIELINVGKFVNGINQWGNYLVYDDKKPLTGAWTVGDHIIAKTPVVGMPKGWRCIASGTPGTWVSEGNL